MVSFNPHEMAIIRFMRLEPDNIYTTNAIGSKMSWYTAEKTLKQLFKRGYFDKGRKPNRRIIYWRIRL